MKKILVACEYSQVVTEAFRDAGASAWSCDIIPAEGKYPQYHFQCDAQKLITQTWQWDLIIAHPPCTYLARSSAVALSRDPGRMEKLHAARDFFMMFYNLDCPICIENPIPLAVAGLPKPTQLINPNDYGHPFTKKTCLWLKDLPPLLPTHANIPWADSWIKHCNGTGKRRARFWEGIAEAMVQQWLPII